MGKRRSRHHGGNFSMGAFLLQSNTLYIFRSLYDLGKRFYLIFNGFDQRVESNVTHYKGYTCFFSLVTMARNGILACFWLGVVELGDVVDIESQRR